MKISKIQTTNFYKRWVTIFVIIAVAILCLIIYFSLSKTVINVTLNPKEFTTSFKIDIKKDIDPANEISKKLTGYLVSTDVSGTDIFTNTNEGEITAEQATGLVTIYNNWSQEQPLAATTRLLTPENILFRIKERVDVPAGGKLENVEVYADLSGPSGNIEPTKFTIPGLWPGLQDKIYAENPSAMTGGLREAKIVTQDIINSSSQQIKQKLLAQAKAELEDLDEVKNNNDKISEQALTSIIIDGSHSAEIGDEATVFETTMTLKVMAVIFNENELKNFTINQIKSELPTDEKIYNSSINLIYIIESYNFEDQTATLSITSTANIVPRLSSSIFDREKIIGLDKQEIKAYLSNFDEISEVQISFSPFWVSKAPALKENIEIKLTE